VAGLVDYTPDGFGLFLTGPQPRFGNRSALDLLAAGESERVSGALAADHEGQSTATRRSRGLWPTSIGSHTSQQAEYPRQPTMCWRGRAAGGSVSMPWHPVIRHEGEGEKILFKVGLMTFKANSGETDGQFAFY